MSFYDTAFAILFAVVFPLYGVLAYQTLLREIESGAPDIRTRAYLKTIVAQWSFVGLLFVLWTAQGRTSSSLGLILNSGWKFWLAAAGALAVIVAFELQRRSAMRNPETRDQVRAAAGSLAALLPHTQREFRWFTGVSLTAGICEELLYRGFLIWYFTQFTTPLWALVGSSLLFGYGHAYQGIGGFLKTAAVGGFIGGLYLLGQSILIPIILHAAMDVIQGSMIFHALRGDPTPPANIVA